MKQIQKMSLERLANSAHFMFITNVCKHVTADTAVKDKVANELHALENALREEDRIFVTSQKSLLSDDIKDADLRRDNIYRAIRKAVNAYLLFPDRETAEAAKVVKQALKDHAIDPRMQLDKETALLMNLIGDFESKYQSQITKLGLAPTVAELKSVNDKLIGVTDDRLHAKSLIIIGDLKRARKASDEAYRTLIQKINALAVIEGDTVYSGLIDLTNTDIKHYKEEAIAHPKKKDGEAKKPGGGTKKPGGDDSKKKPDGGGTKKPEREEDPGEDQA